MPMRARFLLGLAALSFLLVAGKGLADPAGLATSVGLGLDRPGASNELRASYGGQSLALAGLLAMGALRPAATRPALVLLTTLCAGLVAGRTVDAALTGMPTPFLSSLWAFEALMTAAGGLLLIRGRQTA